MGIEGQIPAAWARTRRRRKFPQAELKVAERIMQEAVTGLKKEGRPFCGVFVWWVYVDTRWTLLAGV